MSACVCGSNLEFDACCEPILGGAEAQTAEALMRSRYAAYVVGNLDHIERSNAAAARESFNRLDAQRVVDETEWLGLTMVRTLDGGPEDETGQVEFIFRYKQQGKKMAQHELAHFVREDGAWRYRDSDMNPKSPPVRVAKSGRNDLCSCGSGKKYKKCCGA